ncbi:MAG TPA: biotin/lipoyl-containing protein, partial [Gaiellaceae bacterium]|nr:biotin/lipoyl-containing protein [Gaiellaceae bacterium]
IGAIAVDAARAAGYRSAGTIEGLLTSGGEWFFMEMNTRLQVEHTVTELVTGLDLVREQIHIALGEPLSVTQDDVRLRGHAIECRINAEDPAHGFLPSPGLITAYREPSGPGVRVDSGVGVGNEASGVYDPLIAKLIVHGVDREHARTRMLRALGEYVIDGPTTLIGFHQALLEHPCFIEGTTCEGVVDSLEIVDGKRPLTAQGRTVEQVRTVEVDGRRFEVRVSEPEAPWLELARRRRERVRAYGGSGGHDAIVSPMQGTVLSVAVADGDEVETGQVICIIEAMKMENEVRANRAGTISEFSVAPGQPVTTGQTICVLT